MTLLVLFIFSTMTAAIDLAFWPDPVFAFIAGTAAFCAVLNLVLLVEVLAE